MVALKKPREYDVAAAIVSKLLARNNPAPKLTPEQQAEWDRCASDHNHFINKYCQIYDADAKSWIPFELWPEQTDALEVVHENQLTIGLKNRQIGFSWLFCVAYPIWQMIFQPIATVLIFSKRDDEAVYMLGIERMRGTYNRLPEWMKLAVTKDDAHVFGLSNGSTARAFPTTGGDGYTATYAVIDEADLANNLTAMLNRINPTIDAGGKLVMISRVDKSKPLSAFKEIYRKAKQGLNNWKSIFVPWFVHPRRDQAWYDAKCKDAMENEGSLDSVHEQYPATDTEALAPASLNKRFPLAWINRCYEELKPLTSLPEGTPDIPGLRVYRLPERGKKYGIGSDCAEGLPNSDDSTSYVISEDGEEVANLVGKLTPAIHAALTLKLAHWYNNAGIMVESNNHGHAFIQWYTENGYVSLLLKGHDNKRGWTTNAKGKVLMCDGAAEVLREGNALIHDFETVSQMASIEKSTLSAPDGQMDDRAVGFMVALKAISGRAFYVSLLDD